jgi:hypothetical protein
MLCGKWLFVILNPCVQLALVFAVFYFVFLRLPDFNTLDDTPSFGLIAVLSLFAVATPSSTIYWINGAANYSWVFLIFICFLCLLRALYEGKNLIKDTTVNKILVFIFGLFLGLSNENNAPAALLIFTAFSILCKYSKKPLPKWFNFAFAGIVLGVLYMFLGPALYNRIKTHSEQFGVGNILQNFIYNFRSVGYLLKANLMLPVINFLALAFIGILNRRTVLSNKDYITGVLCFVLSCALAVVLLLLPFVGVGNRVFYSASVFSAATMLFILKYIRGVYKRDFAPHFLLVIFVFAAVFLPFMLIPYINLYRQNMLRQDIIAQAVKRGAPEVAVGYILPILGPTENLQIIYFDPMHFAAEERKRHFGISIQPVIIHPIQSFYASQFATQN